jgi:hypothetical protein
MSRENITHHVEPWPGFQGLTLRSLTRTMIRDWKLWAAERGRPGSLSGFSPFQPQKRAFSTFLPCKFPKEPNNRDFCVSFGAKIHKSDRLLESDFSPQYVKNFT